VCGDDHVVWLVCERLVDEVGVPVGQPIDLDTASAGLLEFGVGAQVGPCGVVELEVATSGVIKGADGVTIGLREIVEDIVAVLVGRPAHRILLEAEVHDRRCRDAHLGRRARGRLQEAVVIEHRMVTRKAHPAVDLQAVRGCLNALKLDSVIELHNLDAIETAEEVEMPPGATELAIGGQLQSGGSLLRNDIGDRVILDGPKFGIVDSTGLMVEARLLQRCGTKETADDIGAERGIYAHRSTIADSVGLHEVAGLALRPRRFGLDG
jgi:hypothetical protein